MNFDDSITFAKQLDADDPLKEFRQKFIIPEDAGKQKIYFLGNSLGLQPKTTQKELLRILEQWSRYGVEAFFTGDTPWMDYHDLLTGPLAKIVGARPAEITVMNQLTVNLHLMMKSFYRPSGKRNKILCEVNAFPSDQYMLETQVKGYGWNPDEVIVEIKPRPGEITLRTEDIVSVIHQYNDSTALVFFSGINYLTGQLFDIRKITEATHAIGAPCGFDLAHAAGNVPLHLHDWDVDFACWCSYKYLNSGPGAVGGVFIHEKHHQDFSLPRFAGWWGYEKSTRFKMEQGFKPVRSAAGWQLSTPSLLLYAAHKSALDIFEEAGMTRLEEKRKLLNDYLWFLLKKINNETSGAFKIITPSEENARGCQVSLQMAKNGKKIVEELSSCGVMTDWREPDVIRLAPVPLYNTYEEVWQFANILQQILQQQ
jgi:kynureninase